jgi:hypothetical protein
MKNIGLALFLACFSLIGFSQTDAEITKIGNLIATGNATELATKFNSSLSVAILDEEATYNKAQGQVVVQNFFADHSPQSFTLIHSGESSEGSKFGKGTLSTLNGSFRVYFLIRASNGSYMIHDIRFEED